MKPPLFGATPYDWLRELSVVELEQLDRGLAELLRQRPGAFSLYRAQNMRNAVHCTLYDKLGSASRDRLGSSTAKTERGYPA
ncbi:hypothetical protein [Chitinolyticbacter albus]|uniref:hypothetical protein n=1 Tax=Chitinolyticbacter albus TaxID=2961951 RepID=UPI00210DD895|nr:hypothetical protein [Chitinolyticbacter albus]